MYTSRDFSFGCEDARGGLQSVHQRISSGTEAHGQSVPGRARIDVAGPGELRDDLGGVAGGALIPPRRKLGALWIPGKQPTV